MRSSPRVCTVVLFIPPVVHNETAKPRPRATEDDDHAASYCVTDRATPTNVIWMCCESIRRPQNSLAIINACAYSLIPSHKEPGDEAIVRALINVHFYYAWKILFWTWRLRGSKFSCTIYPNFVLFNRKRKNLQK